MYTFAHLPFGLNVSSSEFIKCIYQTLGDEIMEYILTYIDDLALVSQNLNQHISRLRLFFKKIWEGNLILKLSKSKFLANEIKYLGFKINMNGIAPSKDKIEAIQYFPTPTNLRDLQSFMGLIHFYRRFQKNFSDLTGQFRHIFSKKNIFIWGVKEQSNFEEIKKNFSSSYFKTSKLYQIFLFILWCKWRGFGAELYKEHEEGNQLAIAYASRGLRNSELRYTVCEKSVFQLIIWQLII